MSSWTPTKYKTRNWADYNFSLKQLGSLSIGFDKNAMMARVRLAMHDIIRQPILAILSDHGLTPEREYVGRNLIAPILYHHLFETGQTQINVEPIVDAFLAAAD